MNAILAVLLSYLIIAVPGFFIFLIVRKAKRRKRI